MALHNFMYTNMHIYKSSAQNLLCILEHHYYLTYFNAIQRVTKVQDKFEFSGIIKDL